MIKFLENIKTGTKVVDKESGKTYDFGYWGLHPYAIVYNEGERNGQDSFAVPASELELKNVEQEKKASPSFSLAYLETLARQEKEVFLYCDNTDDKWQVVIETDDGVVGFGKNLTEACTSHMINCGERTEGRVIGNDILRE
jgi:hypothetical protein